MTAAWTRGLTPNRQVCDLGYGWYAEVSPDGWAIKRARPVFTSGPAPDKKSAKQMALRQWEKLLGVMEGPVMDAKERVDNE